MNNSIKLEEKYSKGFKILSKQGCHTTSEHEIHQLLEQPQIETTRGLGYRDPPYKPKFPMEYFMLTKDSRIIIDPPHKIHVLLPQEKNTCNIN